MERIEGTLGKRYKVVVDIEAIPKGMAPDMWVKLADSGYIFYNSLNGKRPQLHAIGGEELEPAFVDTKGKQVELIEIQKIWEDSSYWDKELYKCKQSPIYYYTEYFSIYPKPSQKNINSYLESVGLGITNDSEITEAAKEVRKKHAESIKLEDLKNLKPNMDKMRDQYAAYTETLKTKFKEVTGTVLNETIETKIVTEITKTSPAEASELLREFLDGRGKWDKTLLRVTDLDVVLRAWETTLK